MAEHGRASWRVGRVSEYEGSQQACAGPLGGSREVQRAEGEKSGSIMPSRMKSDSTWIGLDSGRSPRCVMGGSWCRTRR